MSKIFIADKPTLDTVDTNVNTLVARPAGATQASVDTVSTNVGSEANAASATGSVHAKIKDIRGITGVNGQASGTTTVMGALRRIWEAVGISGQASGTTTVMGYLRRINEAGGVQTVRSVQRGITAGALTVTITSVNMAKTVVHSASKGSAGFVAGRGTITGTLAGRTFSSDAASLGRSGAVGLQLLSITGTRTLAGGTTDLTVREFSARLSTATSIICDGAVEWQVVEYF